MLDSKEGMTVLLLPTKENRREGIEGREGVSDLESEAPVDRFHGAMLLDALPSTEFPNRGQPLRGLSLLPLA
jgi:hypothetical protein